MLLLKISRLKNDVENIKIRSVVLENHLDRKRLSEQMSGNVVGKLTVFRLRLFLYVYFGTHIKNLHKLSQCA